MAQAGIDTGEDEAIVTDFDQDNLSRCKSPEHFPPREIVCRGNSHDDTLRREEEGVG